MGFEHGLWRIGRWVIARGGAVALGMGLGCTSDVVLCSSDADCETGDVCEVTGYCSNLDESCDSGRRYTETAGDGLAFSCVQDTPSVGENSGSATTGPDPTTTTPTPTTVSDPDDSGISTITTTTTTGPDDTTVGVEDTSTTDPSDSTGPTVERVTDGLLVLYRFDEGDKTTVFDQSEVEPPIDLTIEGMDFLWQGNGLLLDGNSIVRAQGPVDKLLDGCQATNEITVEAWVTPQAASMEGPARIVTFSEDSGTRNFTLGQGMFEVPSNPYVGRMRTNDATGSNNGTPSLTTDTIASPVLTHLLYMRSNGTDRLYVDGALEAEDVRTGSYSNWSDMAQFACGNEVSLDRPWEGTLHLVAVYDHALDSEEIALNFNAGP